MPQAVSCHLIQYQSYCSSLTFGTDSTSPQHWSGVPEVEFLQMQEIPSNEKLQGKALTLIDSLSWNSSFVRQFTRTTLAHSALDNLLKLPQSDYTLWSIHDIGVTVISELTVISVYNWEIQVSRKLVWAMTFLHVCRYCGAQMTYNCSNLGDASLSGFLSSIWVHQPTKF